MTKKLLFICGSMNITTQMQQIVGFTIKPRHLWQGYSLALVN